MHYKKYILNVFSCNRHGRSITNKDERPSMSNQIHKMVTCPHILYVNDSRSIHFKYIWNVFSCNRHGRSITNKNERLSMSNQPHKVVTCPRILYVNDSRSIHFKSYKSDLLGKCSVYEDPFAISKNLGRL